ncbi:MAG: NAD(P)/FAD-dependent oxidoreductase, partial [Candidatus Eiseniibacteriota bacterium]
GVAGELARAGAPRVRRWRIESSSASVVGELPAGGGLGVARRTFDALLRRRAAALGAFVREGERVAAVERAGTGFVVRTALGAELSARRLIVAAGRGARLPGVPVRDTPAVPGFVALKAHFRGEADRDLVQLFPLGGAYVGIAPVGPGTFNVCFLARRSAFREAGKSAEALLDEGARRNAAFARARCALERESPWTAAASMSWRGARPEQRGILFAGDSAAEIAPFLGEGLSLALESGRLAASHVDAPAGSYAREWSRRFAGRLRTGRALQRVLLSARGADLAVRALARWPGLAERIVLGTRSRELLAVP